MPSCEMGGERRGGLLEEVRQGARRGPKKWTPSSSAFDTCLAQKAMLPQLQPQPQPTLGSAPTRSLGGAPHPAQGNSGIPRSILNHLAPKPRPSHAASSATSGSHHTQPPYKTT